MDAAEDSGSDDTLAYGSGGGAYEDAGVALEDAGTAYDGGAPPSYLYNYQAVAGPSAASSSPADVATPVSVVSPSVALNAAPGTASKAPQWQKTYVELAKRCGSGFDDPGAHVFLLLLLSSTAEYRYTQRRSPQWLLTWRTSTTRANAMDG